MKYDKEGMRSQIKTRIKSDVFDSIKGKYTIFLVMGVVLTSFLVGGIGVLLMYHKVQYDTAEMMNLHCREEADIVNDALNSTRQSVIFMQQYAQRQRFELEDLIKRETRQEEFCSSLAEMFEGVAQGTEGAIDYYFRFNPEFFSPKAGFLYTREMAHKTISKGYIEVEVTDFSQYDPSDDKVKWMYEPIEQDKGMWIAPYWSTNLKINIISYVEPVRLSGRIVGVVGMDVDFDHVLNTVVKGRMYDSGYALLIGKDGSAIKFDDRGENQGEQEIGKDEVACFSDSLKKFSSGKEMIAYNYQNVEKRMVYYTLNNAMRLVLVADAYDIFLQLDMMMLMGSLAALVVAVFLAIIGYRFTQRLTLPLEELVDVAKMAGDGNLSLTIPGIDRVDEVGKLARAFEEMTEHLQQYVDYVQNLAYKDALTDVQNKAAYDMSMEQMDVDIRMGRAKFAIIMIDLNYLKRVNDTYGHEVGNRYILTLCQRITDVFAVESVYRIGGDEFVVLIKEAEYEQREELLKKLQEKLEQSSENEQKPWENVSAAIGVAEFDPDVDDGPDEVFKRADEAMYARKLEMKAARE